MNKTDQNILFEPLQMGDYELKNRIIMAPLTRQRAGKDFCVKPFTAEYYSQRATAGLIISEACNISLLGTGYPNSPGIYTQKQINAWKNVTAAVHQEGGLIFCQLWHVGRHSHPEILNGHLPLAPSAIREKGQVRTETGKLETVKPAEMTEAQIYQTIADYAIAAENAIEAGFDGVEIHGANGYLIDQFFQDGTNLRTDSWGGSLENRARFVFEVIQAISRKIGSKKTGIRLSPSGTKLDISDSNSKKHFSWLISTLNDFNLAYLHLLEPWFDVSQMSNYAQNVATYYRPFYSGTLIANNGFDANSAAVAIRQNVADAVAFGRLFISNPDLVARFQNKQPLTAWDETTFYFGSEKGYTDYPRFNG